MDNFVRLCFTKLFISIMRTRFLTFLMIAILAIGMGSCGGDDSTSSDNNNNGNNNNGNNNTVTLNTLKFTEGGQTRTLYTFGQGSYSNNNLFLLATDSVSSPNIRVFNISLIDFIAAGTYNTGTTFNGNHMSTLTFTYGYVVNGKNISYRSNNTSTAGSITITEITAHSLKATFSATLAPEFNATSNAVITNGSINATF